MDRIIAKKLRKGILVASISVMVLAIGIILFAMMIPGNWIEVHANEPVSIKMNGTDISISCTATVDSNMPYTMNDVDVSLLMVDRARGSSTTLYSESGIQIPPGRSTIPIDTKISASTALLIIRDQAAKDGSPLSLELKVDCRYMLDMAGFQLTSDILVPVTSDGCKLEWHVSENTDESFILDISGLANWLIPDDRELSVTGGGETFTLNIGSRDGAVTMSFRSDDGLDGVLDRIASSADAICKDGDKVLDWDSDDIGKLQSIVSLARGLL